MREIRKIDIENSISKRKLIFEESWFDKLNRIGVYILSLYCIFLSAIILKNDKFLSQNDKFVQYYILPLSLIFGVYLFYRNATERTLIKVTANNNKEEIRTKLLEYAEKQNFKVSQKSKYCLVFNGTFDSLGTINNKSRIVFIKDNLILFTILRENLRINLPTFFTHLFFKRDLKKIFHKASA